LDGHGRERAGAGGARAIHNRGPRTGGGCACGRAQ
jgi:hypothetical protein